MSISANFPNVFPSLELNFAQGQQLDPRVTFSRSTTAPYYDGKTSVLAEQNLVKYSQDWSQSPWTNNGASSPTTTANAGTAPDGTNTATSLVFSSQYQNRIQIVGATIGQIYTFSFYAQNVNGNTALVIEYDTGGFQSAITTTASWARYSVTWTATVASVYVGIQDRNASGFGTTLVWGAQLEQRSSVTAYNATTTSAITNYIPQLLTAPINAPRFDFNPVTGESLGLLIEQSSTNLLLQSQFASGWTNTNTTSTQSANIAPDGTQTAIKLVENSGLAYHNIQQSVSVTTPTFSLYAKAGERSQIAIFVGGAGVGVGFDLTNGTVISIAGYTSGSATSTITSVGNGWYRCAIAFAGTASFFQIGMASGNIGNYTGNGYSGVYIWGAQAEALAFSTSYIPTTSAQVTRASDNASMTGTNFSSWFNQGQGTVYCESWFLSPVSGYPSPYSINDGTNNNRIQAYVNNSLTSLGGDITLGLVSQANVLATVSSMTSYVKSAFSFQSKVVNFAGAGVAGTTNTTANIPNGLNKLSIGTNALGNAFSIYIKKFSYYPIAVTSAQNQALTGS